MLVCEPNCQRCDADLKYGFAVAPHEYVICVECAMELGITPEEYEKDDSLVIVERANDEEEA